MDLTMRLKRLPLEMSKPIVDRIRADYYEIPNNLSGNDVIKKNLNSEFDEEVDLDKTYILDKHEYELVTKIWSSGAVLELPNNTIYQIFEKQVSKNPYKKAITFRDQFITYEELNKQANQLAYHLQSLGVHPEKNIAVYLDRSIEAIVSILAILKTGGAYIPIDPSYPKERVEQILLDSQATLVITNQNLHHNISSSKLNNVLIDNISKQLLNYPTQNLDVVASPNHLAYIIYTSGSTGVPKGVQVENKSLMNFIMSIAKEYEVTEKDTVVQFASLGFDVSVFDIFVSLCTGATLCIADEEERKSPELLTKLIRRHGVTVAELPPAILPLLNPSNFPTLRLISVGGEMFSGDLVNKWASPKRRFINGYGPTETTVAVTLFDCKGQWDKNPPIGRPIYNVESYILNNNLEPVPVGVPGELHIGGMCVAKGYLNREDLTKEKFVCNPFNKESNSIIYKTGDLARWLPDGNIEILGRADRQIKIRGFRVELEEIESALAEEPRIKQVTVEVHDEINRDRQLIAYIVTDPMFQVSVKDLRIKLSKKLPKYMIPARFVEILEIPLTPNGKVDRKALPKPDDSRPDDEDYVVPRNEIETIICNEIFSPILGIKQIGAMDNFFDLGGNSLQATLVVSQIREIFKIDINLIDFFQSPIVESLANFVEQKEEHTKHKKHELIKELSEIEESWIKIHKAPEAKFRIVCFPYAGASTRIFQKWPEKLAPDFEIITIDLPGHDTKINEKPFDSTFEVANRLASELEGLSDKPLIFLGQSGGAILAFETSRLLLKKGISIHRLFALASRAPHAELSEPSRYHLPDKEFLLRVNEFGGLSKEFLNNKDLLNLMIPTMRADEKLAETYSYTGKLGVMPFPISIYGGKEDRIGRDILEEWIKLSSVECEFRLFDGGHFFLQENEDTVLYSIVESISQFTI